ncbi:MAG: glycosyltransferase family 4 protein [Flavobacteriaceae bacterium]
MAKEKPLDFLILGPAHPYRGGIASTQHALAKSLISHDYQVSLWTFTHLYPGVLFPGKTQFSTEDSPKDITIERSIHAYHPFQWKQVAEAINELQPKFVVFRYWTPFLSPCWSSIAKYLSPKITKIGWVDNWHPHEPKPLDRILTGRFEKAMDCFTTLSAAVACQIEKNSQKRVWGKMHPIERGLPPQISKEKAREKLGINESQTVLLFFGLIRAYKGLDLLLKAFKDHPEKHLLIVGECYEKWRKYQHIIDQYNIEKQLTVINRYVSMEEAASYFSAADATVLPYITATQSGVLALAYHFETPLVVTNHPGLSQCIEEDETGVVCKPEINALSSALTKVTKPSANRNFKVNLNRTKTNYSWANYAQEWAKFIFDESNEN